MYWKKKKKKLEDIARLMKKKPTVSISAESIIYYPDINERDVYFETLSEPYKKGVQIDGTPNTAKVR